MSATLGQDADDPKAGMTLAELRELVDRADRMQLPGDTLVTGRTTMRGRIRALALQEPVR
ncbi:hypothetical protein Ssi03_62330 [Sphaerisporangium siamense]|uniref:Uncharacterized protein n=1 Tax=Sphaerisporangium siamense TaxID=795645 RepID=A0A7W7D9Q3_9ACTN|nr:hypothetical protein [Sphaerisporangium siamense]MBB4702544.1 hypothetical protein [Sphaerisporangium siamense]GII88243.1 hypothetical protein Ssi03_62330 [Sphaerisporangium siamense]